VIKVIVFAGIGLVLGLGGGSGVAIMKAKKQLAAAAQDSIMKKDSLALAAKEKADSAKAGEGEHQPTVAAIPAPGLKHDSTAASAPNAMASDEHAAVPGSTKSAPALPDTAKTLASVPGRIAKIFAAMSAKDAARVLQQMDDADIQTVLAGLNDKQAAAILAGFPVDRAAAISKAAIRGKKGAS
jgi:hypothetical protein